MTASRFLHPNRREFVLRTAGFLSAPGIPVVSQAASGREILDSIISIDLHTHPGPAHRRRALTGPALRRIRQSKLSAFAYSVVSDVPDLGRKEGRTYVRGDPSKGQLYRYTKKQLDSGINAIHKADMVIGLSARDIETARNRGQKAAILAIEGGDFAEDDLGAIEEFHGKGVRIIQPVHKRGNQFADSQEHSSHGQGLSDLGIEFVHELNRLKILVDVSHMTRNGVAKTAEASSKPLVLSHVVHTRSSRAFRRFKRWAPPEYSKIVADTGGVVCVWNLTGNRLHEALGYASEKAMFINSFVQLADAYGVEKVGLGSDLDSTTGWFDSYKRLPELADELMNAGFNDEEVGKILGGNVLRVLREVSGG